MIDGSLFTLNGPPSCDPCGCAASNARIGAAKIWTKKENGLLQKWGPTVLLNPPGGYCDAIGQEVIKANKKKKRPPCTETGDCGLPAPHTHVGKKPESSQKKWWQELVYRHAAGEVEAAIFVCFSIELFQTSQNDPQGPLPLDFPICFPSDRIKYLRPDGTEGKSPPHSSAIICVSTDEDVVARFGKAFRPYGRVFIAHSERG